MKKIPSIISKSVVFVDRNKSISDSVKKMINAKVSCILITDDDTICGIVTERDIVHKITLLDVEEKLSHKISSIMTRPVHFVRTGTLKTDIVNLHYRNHARHFPVLRGKAETKSNLVGLLTITDVARKCLTRTTRIDVEILLSTMTGDSYHHYELLFKQIDFRVRPAPDMITIVAKNKTSKSVLIIDLDDRDDEQVSTIIKQTKTYRGTLLFLTKQTRLKKAFQESHKHVANHHLALKPVDISFIQWLITRSHVVNSLAIG